MRFTPWFLALALQTAPLLACDTQSGPDDETLTTTADEAIVYVDDELAIAGIQRDLTVLDDGRLHDEVRAIAAFAVDHGCDVVGVLGGVWLDDAAVDGGTHHGRWFKLDRSTGGDLAGTYTPVEDSDGGVFDGDWESLDGLAGTLAGDYYAYGGGDGVYLGEYEETTGDAAGMLGGLWYRVTDEGGVYFGVWGHCGAGADAIEPESY